MSDRTTALVFAAVFEHLAEPEVLMTVPDQARTLAKKMWGLMSDYDFSPYQMYCDDALLKLGLAHRVTDKYNPDETIVEYLR